MPTRHTKKFRIIQLTSCVKFAVEKKGLFGWKNLFHTMELSPNGDGLMSKPVYFNTLKEAKKKLNSHINIKELKKQKPKPYFEVVYTKEVPT